MAAYADNKNLTLGTLSIGLVIAIVLTASSLNRLLVNFPFSLSLEIFMLSFIATAVLTVLLTLFIVRHSGWMEQPRKRR